MKGLHMVSFILLIVGGLNWLLVGVFQWDLVAAIFGGMDTVVARIIYILVGLATLVILFTHKRDCRYCNKSSMPSAAPQM